MKAYNKLLAILAVMAMAFVPATAQESGPENNPQGVVMHKRVENTGTNAYKITLEAYVTGQTTTIVEETTTPVDFVLLLDVSTSMGSQGDKQAELMSQFIPLTTGDKLDEVLHKDFQNQTNNWCNYKFTKNNKLRYQIQFGGTGNMYNLAWFEKGKGYGSNPDTQTSIWGRETGWYWNSSGNPYFSPTYQESRWTKYTANSANDVVYTDVKIDLLQKSVNEFISKIRASKTEDDADHKIGIVTFAGDVVQEQAIVDANSTSLDNIVNNLHLHLGGYTNQGVALAEAETLYKTLYGISDLSQMTTSTSSKGRAQCIILFTDGAPSVALTDEITPLSDAVKIAIDKSYLFKSNGAKVYSVGIYNDAEIKGSINILGKQVSTSILPETMMSDYLDYISSDYPEAHYVPQHLNPFNRSVGDHIITLDGGEHKFYFKYDGTNGSLEDMFKTIAQETTEGGASYSLTADATATIDVMSKYFILPSNATTIDIKTYTAEVLYKVNNEYTFKPKDAQLFTVTISEDRKRVEVKGFDYSANWVGEETTTNPITGATSTEYHGKELVIEIPIVIDPENVGGNNVYTNEPTSGIYFTKLDGSGEWGQVSWFERPTVDIPNIVIEKSGMHVGESAFFELSKVNESGQVLETYPFTIIITCKEEGVPAIARVKIQDVGRYKVTEKVDWSWAYTCGLIEEYDVEDTSVTTEQWNAQNFYASGMTPEGYPANTIPTVHTVVDQTTHSITRNVNAFTEDSTPKYFGTLFQFSNTQKETINSKSLPARAESIVTNKFIKASAVPEGYNRNETVKTK